MLRQLRNVHVHALDSPDEPWWQAMQGGDEGTSILESFVVPFAICYLSKASTMSKSYPQSTAFVVQESYQVIAGQMDYSWASAP